MPGPYTGIHGTDQITIKAIDSAGLEEILVGVQGDPSFGEQLPDQKEQELIMVRGDIVDAIPTDEQPEEFSWSALDTDETKVFTDFATFQSSPAPTTVSLAGAKRLKLQIIRQPVAGSARTIEYASCMFRVTPQGGRPATVQITAAQCFGRTVI